MCSLNTNNNVFIRPLRADEIDVRIGTEKKENGVATAASFLLYKDARCDMRILDELFTPFGWQREHKELKGTIYCGVSVKHGAEWITKWDAGAESNVEKEKGEASDSFKRACFNWGIGVELYTAPFIWIRYNQGETGRNINLHVAELGVSSDKRITRLVIKDSKDNIRYQYTAPAAVQQPQPATDPRETRDKAPIRPSDLLDMVRAAETVAALSAIWKANTALIERDGNLRDAFTRRRVEIEQNSNNA